MSEIATRSLLHQFSASSGGDAVLLPFLLDELLAEWQSLRPRMIRSLDPDFSRVEWAYLIQFVDKTNLGSVYTDTFGQPADFAARRLHLPRRRIAVWLPNNVSLLGPLTMILMSLTGSEVWIKSGSRGSNLCQSFRDWAFQALAPGNLQRWLADGVRIDSFDRHDQRNLEMARWADVRILFGGDEAAQAVERLPHRADTTGFYFTNKVSEAWVDPPQITEETAIAVAKVFGVYGQAGCTSPKRIVLVGGDAKDASHFAGLLERVWPKVWPQRVPRHVASANVLAQQWAQALGQSARVIGENAAVLINTPACPVTVKAHMALYLQWGDPAEIRRTQASNLQTIGHALADPADPSWLTPVSDSAAVRFVPLIRMHDFGPVWDGIEWFRGLFQVRQIQTDQ